MASEVIEVVAGGISAVLTLIAIRERSREGFLALLIVLVALLLLGVGGILSPDRWMPGPVTLLAVTIVAAACLTLLLRRLRRHG